MAHKTALIVDDSRTARRFLARVLEQYEMQVQTAESAEEALQYLSESRPDVIFMDHMMPGMDGFQAVRAIKNNPATATIPIMMYTSQSGELYVGQARALGAVGVLPKQIKPVEVSELLESLHLVPSEEIDAQDETQSVQNLADEPAIHDDEDDDNVDEIARAMEPADWDELHRWLERMLEHHNTSLREDVEATVTRLLTERLPEPASEAVVETHVEEDTVSIPAVQKVSPRGGPGPVALLVVALAALAATFLWLHLDTQQKWRAVSAQNADLLAALDTKRLAVAEDATGTRDYLDAERESLSSRYAELLEALEWSVNQAGKYAADEVPLSDDRLELITGLFERLRGTGFRGSVELEVHAGDFCLVEGRAGEWRPAPNDVSVGDCGRIGRPSNESFSGVERESVAFANFRANLENTGSDIRLLVEELGNLAPIYPYPVSPQGITAGEWNRIAARNNRVTVRLIPDGDLPVMLGQEVSFR